MKKVFLVVTLTALAALAAMYFGGFAGSTATRVSREHSVSLPASVSNIYCLYPISVSALRNFPMISTFTVAPNDVAGVLSQFRQTDTKTIGSDSLYKSESRDGNEVIIQVTPIDASRTAFYIRTMRR